MAIAVLAISIGANTAIFSIINAVLFRPLPVHAPEELAFVYPAARQTPAITLAEAASYRADTTVFTAVGWTSNDRAAIGSGDLLTGESVSANYFQLLGVRPRQGRGFDPTMDESAGATPAMVISDRLWRNAFDADPLVVGRAVRLKSNLPDSGWRYAVVGVMDASFTGVASPWINTEFWTLQPQRDAELANAYGNLFPDLFSDRRSRLIGTLIARRASSVTIAQVQSLVTARHTNYLDVSPFNRGVFGSRSLVVLDSRLVSLPMDAAGRVDPIRLAQALMAVTGLVLVIGVANLVGITIARGVARRAEIALRLTLGASRGRVARQLLTEGLLLSVAAGVAGLITSRAFVGVFLATLPNLGGSFSASESIAVPVDLRVLAFTAAIVICVGLAMGMAPLREATRVSLVPTLAGLSGFAAQRVSSRLRQWIVIPQIGLCTALLIIGVVAGRALLRVVLVDPGYRSDAVALGTIGLPVQSLGPALKGDARRAASAAASDRRAEVFSRLLESVSDSPAVDIAALANALPSTSPSSQVVDRDGFSTLSRHYSVVHATVSARYFDVLQLPIRLGRGFSEQDGRANAKVAVISESLAAQIWPGRPALGRFLGMHAPGTINVPDWVEIVGVVGDVRSPLSEGDANPVVYLPLSQQPFAGFSLTLLARGASGIGATTRAIGRAAETTGVDMRITNIRSLDEVIARQRYPRRIFAALLMSSAVIGLVLATLGLYGVAAYSVTQRLKELGIRAALGADHGDLANLVLREGLLLTVIGSLSGLVLAVAGVGVVSHYVLPIPAIDIITILAVCFILSFIVLVACYFPARRAAQVDPIVVLRSL